MKKILVVLILIASCKSDSLPEGVLPPEKMKLIVWDMLLADEYVLSVHFADTSKTVRQHLTENYRKVFSVYKISSEEFYSSFRYYEEHPQLHKVLMDSVHAYGTRERSKNDTLIKKRE